MTTIQNPQGLIAEHLLQAVQRPTVTDFMHLAGDAEIFEMEVREGAPVADLTLTDAATEGLLGEGVLVVAIERGNGTLTPRGDTEIRVGDLVTVFSEQGTTDRLTRTFTGEDTQGTPDAAGPGRPASRGRQPHRRHEEQPLVGAEVRLVVQPGQRPADVHLVG